MAATFQTKEALEDGITEDAIKGLIRLRMKAGAIRCWVTGNHLMTEWNVIGEQ
jgi:hypothetical protein